MVTRTRERAANNHRERYSVNHDPDHAAGNEPQVNYSPDRSEAAHQDYAMRFEEALGGQAQTAYRSRAMTCWITPRRTGKRSCKSGSRASTA